MNLRFSEDSVRFRISRSELEHLLRDGEISQSTFFPDGKLLTYRILTSPEHEVGLSIEWRANELILFAPSFQLQDMLVRPPAKDLGCYQDMAIPGRRILRLVLEVDLFTERRSRKTHSAGESAR